MIMNPYEMQWRSATPGLLIILLDQSESMVNKYDDNHVHELALDRVGHAMLGHNQKIEVALRGIKTSHDGRTVQIDADKVVAEDPRGLLRKAQDQSLVSVVKTVYVHGFLSHK